MKRLNLRFWLLLGAGLLLFSCQNAAPAQPTTELVPSASEQAPAIEQVQPRRLLPGAIIVLQGHDFGIVPGEVLVDGQALPVLAWTEDAVRARLPRNATPGEATVALQTRAGSTTASFKIADPYIAPRVHEIPCLSDFFVCSVYLPPEYDSQPERRFPVVYQFQGMSWTNRTTVQNADIAALAASYGFIIVFDWPITTDEDPLQLVREIDAAYRTIPQPEARGMWLISASGGRGLRIASEHSEVFSAVDASGACVGAFDTPGARRLRIRLDIGDDDTVCGTATLRAHEELLAAGIPHQYELYPGGRHTVQTIFGETTIRAVFDFFRSAFATP